jgi:hypothetical protein
MSPARCADACAAWVPAFAGTTKSSQVMQRRHPAPSPRRRPGPRLRMSPARCADAFVAWVPTFAGTTKSSQVAQRRHPAPSPRRRPGPRATDVTRPLRRRIRSVGPRLRGNDEALAGSAATTPPRSVAPAQAGAQATYVADALRRYMRGLGPRLRGDDERGCFEHNADDPRRQRHAWPASAENPRPPPRLRPRPRPRRCPQHLVRAPRSPAPSSPRS